MLKDTPIDSWNATVGNLATVFPNFVRELETALASKGHNNLIPQLTSTVIDRYTYDSSVNAGYIYLVCPIPSLHFSKLAAKVAQTISFLNSGFNIDVNHDGYIFGIELLDREDIFVKLKDICN